MRSAIAFGLGVVATITVAIGAWLIIVYTGMYNVAATDAHADLMRWTLDTTMHRSVSRRAEEVAVPGEVTAEALASAAQTYDSTCAHCHGAPGRQREDWARNMRPMPPEMAQAAAHMQPRELFWIIRNGIKMSGMPAFGPLHDDEALWGLVGFVAGLPAMTPEEYSAATGGGTRRGAAPDEETGEPSH